ncbi:MAG: ABC transporter ATP-binding protein [Pseudomonadota bacterium]
MTSAEKRRFALLAVFAAAASCIDTISLAAVVPFVSVIVDPSTLETNQYIAMAYDAVGRPATPDFLFGLLVAIVGLLVASSCLSFLVQAQANRFAAGCQERFGRDFLKTCLGAPYVWYLRKNVLVLARMFHNHVVVWGRDFVLQLLTFCSQAFTIFLPILLLLVMAPLAGTLGLAVVAIIAAMLLFFIRRHTVTLQYEKRSADERSTLLVNQALAGIKDIKLSSREPTFVAMFGHFFHVLCRTHAKIANWNLLPNAIVLLLGQLVLVGLAYGLWRAGLTSGEITSQMALVLLVSSRIVPAVNRIGGSVAGLWGVAPWIEGLIETLSEIETDKDDGRAPQPAGKAWQRIALDHVTFRFPAAERTALVDLSIEIEQGKSYAIVGPSGAGKSTAVDLLLGLLTPMAGRITVDGTDIDDFGMRNWQAGIGYVPQSPYMTDGSLRENIAFGVPPSQIDDDRVRACLEMVDLIPLLGELEDGLETRLGDRGVRLSGGQRQRVAIARALYDAPDLLVLDEATSALDNISENEVRNAIARLHGHVTTVIIAHRLSTVRQCDKLFVLEQGRLVAEGAYDELQRTSPLFRSLALHERDGDVAHLATQG